MRRQFLAAMAVCLSVGTVASCTKKPSPNPTEPGTDSVTVVFSVDSILIESVDTVLTDGDTIIVLRVDTVLVGPDTVLVGLDTIVQVDTLLQERIDTIIQVDTIFQVDTIAIAAPTLDLAGNTLTVEVGQQAVVSVTAVNGAGLPVTTDNLIWISGAAGIASVNALGVVTGVAVGSTTILAIEDAYGLSGALPTRVVPGG